MKIGLLKGTLYLTATKNVSSYFVHFYSSSVGNVISSKSAEWNPGTSVWGVNEFIATFIVLFAYSSLRDLNIIMVTISEFWENRRSYHRRPHFPYGYKRNYDYACTMKPYDIIKVQNALVKSAHYVTEYSTTYLHSVTNLWTIHRVELNFGTISSAMLIILLIGNWK